MVKNQLFKLFPAFKAKNYRYYFIGQLISQIGSWLQIVAQGWLVLTLTNSAFLVGLVAAASTLPSFLFSLIGGVIVDRFDKTKLIIITQSLSMILAIALGVLTIFNLVTVWQIILLAFLLGIVNAIDMPARQAYVSELVEKEYIASAVALNAAIYNGGRVVGPSLAGLLIAWVNLGGAFIINGLTFIAAIIAQLFIIPILHKKPDIHPHPVTAIKEGLRYTWDHPYVRSLIILTAIVSIFGWSYMTILPVIAKNTFGVDASGLGYLFAATGAGAILATVVVSSYSNKFSPYVFIVGGIFMFAISLIAFSFVTTLIPAYIFLFFVGFGLLIAFSVINTQIQHSADHDFKGRVISVYLLMFVGLFPFGNFEIGFAAEHLGAQEALRIGGIIVLITIITFYFLRTKIKEAHENYLTMKEVDEGIGRVVRSSIEP